MFWPDFTMPPINLLNFPKQDRDYMTAKRNIAADNRARSLKLNPAPRQTNKNSRIIIEPARGVGCNMQTEQILNCIARRNGSRR